MKRLVLAKVVRRTPDGGAVLKPLGDMERPGAVLDFARPTNGVVYGRTPLEALVPVWTPDLVEARLGVPMETLANNPPPKPEGRALMGQHADPPCHACGVEGPLELYQARAHVERLIMLWGSGAWRRW